MHNYSNMRNKQIGINTWKNLPFFKISRTHACKMTPFSLFREFAPPIQKIPPFPRKWVWAWYTLWSGGGGGGGGGGGINFNPSMDTLLHPL